MEEVWGRWQFSPQLEPQLQELVAFWNPDGAQPYKLQLKANSQEVSNPDHLIDTTLCNDECTEEVQEESVNKSTINCNSLIEQDSVVQCSGSSSSIVDILEERMATDELCAVSVEQLMPLLPNLSDTAMMHLCQTVCASGPEEQSRLSNLLFTCLFLPRLRDSGVLCSRQVLAALQQTVDCFPHQAIAELFVPLMLVLSSNHSTIETLVAQLSLQNKRVLLRLFLESGITLLSEWQLPALHNLIFPTTDEHLNQQLVNLLTTSLKSFPKSVKFGKLLVTVIQQMGPNLSAVMKEQLIVAVSQHKSLMKKVAEKALKALD